MYGHVCFFPDAQRDDAIKEGMAEIEKQTCVQFQERTSGPRVKIDQGNGSVLSKFSHFKTEYVTVEENRVRLCQSVCVCVSQCVCVCL